ncbi:hypothetical protein [Acidianus brierleyi]|uniref:hypothetical protein n=1 Tax=Acidianus brierleyi TaxID=41673 RepID=UPI0014434A93|nr:hypothetical protein [Acidianus brierleyi]AWR94084.2 hypothetical protein DFR85_05210 [Acidianus brierleyi]
MEKDSVYLLILLGIIPIILSSYFNIDFIYFLSIVLIDLSFFAILKIYKFTFIIPFAMIFSLKEDPYIVILSIFLSLFTYYFPKYIPSLFVPFSLGISLLHENIGLELFSIIILISIFYVLKLDSRGIIVDGIIFLIVSALLNRNGLLQYFSNIAYFYLIFGIISIIIENHSFNKLKYSKLKILLIYLPFSILLFILGIPHNYYWWNYESFIFRMNALSLGVPGLYYPQINQIIGLYPISHFLISKFNIYGIKIYYAIFSYISGIFAFLFFNRIKAKYSTIFSLIYEIMSPYYDPQIMLGYALLPLILYIITLNISNYFKYPTAMLLSSVASSFYLFPLTFIIISPFLIKNSWKVSIAILGSNLFWIIPIVISGPPSLPIIRINFIYLLVALTIFIAAYARGTGNLFFLECLAYFIFI